MQVLNKQFFKFLNSIFNTSELKCSVYDEINTYFGLLRNYMYIPIEFDESLSKYPIYPENFKYYKSLKLSDTKSFSSQKIISTALPKSEFLNKTNIEKELISINASIEKIPTNINTINFEHFTQKIFLNNDYFNNYMLTLSQSKVYENDYIFYNLLFTKAVEYDSTYDGLNVSQLITLYISLHDIYTNMFQYDDLFLYFYELEDQVLTNDKLISSFTTFLSTVDSNIYTDLSKFILKNNFNMIIPADNILTMTTNYIIDNELSNLISLFTSFLENKYTDILKSFFEITPNKLNNFLFDRIFNLLINSIPMSNIINQTILKNELSNKLCEDYITKLLSSLNKYDLQKYLLPIFLYSNSPIKFINIIPQFIKQFIIDGFLPVTKYDELISTNELISVINNLITSLDTTNINNFFNSLNINEIYFNNSLSGMVSSIFTTEIFQSFTDSDEFSTFIINMIDNVDAFLYDNKLVQYNQNWYHHIELTKSFFKTFFLKYINYQTDNNEIQNIIFPELQTTLDEYYTDHPINYTGSVEYIDLILSNQKHNDTLKTNIYNLTKNVFYGHLNKTIYNKILTYYIT